MAIPFLFAGGFFLLVAVILVWSVLHEKKRTEEFAQLAEELGWTFHPKGDESVLGRMGRFHLFSQGDRRKMKNLIVANNEDGEVAVFGYQYTTGSGDSRSTHSQNVACFQSSDLDLPKFALRPEHLFHKIGGMMGYEDIDFRSYPEFSTRFLLRGDDRDAIERLFSDRVLGFFEGHDKISVEGDGNQLIFYRAGKRIKPDGVVPFLQEASEVFKLFKDR